MGKDQSEFIFLWWGSYCIIRKYNSQAENITNTYIKKYYLTYKKKELLSSATKKRAQRKYIKRKAQNSIHHTITFVCGMYKIQTHRNRVCQNGNHWRLQQQGQVGRTERKEAKSGKYTNGQLSQEKRPFHYLAIDSQIKMWNFGLHKKDFNIFTSTRQLILKQNQVHGARASCSTISFYKANMGTATIILGTRVLSWKRM